MLNSYRKENLIVFYKDYKSKLILYDRISFLTFRLLYMKKLIKILSFFNDFCLKFQFL